MAQPQMGFAQPGAYVDSMASDMSADADQISIQLSDGASSHRSADVDDA